MKGERDVEIIAMCSCDACAGQSGYPPPKLFQRLGKLYRWRMPSGAIVGFRRSEWWIGVRIDFTCNWLEVNILGLTLFIPEEMRWRP